MLPATKFFIPNEQFIVDLINAVGWSVIYDVGCGVGHVTNHLRTVKPGSFKSVIPIDFIERDHPEVCDIVITDARFYPFRAGSCVMLCRPCHGVFVEMVIDQAIRSGARLIIYVGIERNLEADLGQYIDHFRLSPGGAVGESGECMWVMEV